MNKRLFARRLPGHSNRATHDATAVACAVALACALASGSAAAQSVDGLRDAVRQAIVSNPDVGARYNAYRAAGDGIDVARAAFLPRVDLNADIGYGSDRITSRNPASDSYSRSGVGLSLTQLLWDGLGTQRDVERAGHEKLARYFELMETTEQTALEAARAWYDVQRYRRLVALAEDNYVQHRYASNQIGERFRAGVGRGVDLEQANARHALAESNLTTEVANLHDVTARYQRIVGVAPAPGTAAATALGDALPADPAQVLATAVLQSPAVSASIEALRAARSATQLREAGNLPKVEARLRGGFGNNYEGIRDQKRDATAEIVMNWNLYDGGANQARVRQQTNLMSQAADLRDKACRDVRQTAAIAFNDTRRLTEQIALLDRNTLAIVKARDAYRQQFDIGQRSLLDLLNAENEVYTARRAYANAEYDRALAFARTHAGMSQLTTRLGLARAEVGADTAGWAAGDDAPQRCPVLTVDVVGTNIAELDKRVPVAPPLAPASPAAVPPRR
ncbi:MAG: TolC family outer membrane protein [Burkholderiaceae bacterium]